jgi:hypothetical protein
MLVSVAHAGSQLWVISDFRAVQTNVVSYDSRHSDGDRQRIWRSLRNRSPRYCGERRRVRGPCNRIYRGYLLRENPWLQLQGTRRVLLNVRYALQRSTTHSGNPAFRRPSINSVAFDCAPRAIHADTVKAGSVSSRRAAASRASASRPRWAKADARQR